MVDGQYKRNIAYKLRVGDLLSGKPIINEEKFSFLELGNKKINRVNVVGNIVDKYENTGESKYIFFTLDDGSGQIKLKVFGDDSDKFKNFNQGETVVVIGVLRHWNNETYIQPEIIKLQDPKYLLVRKMELEKERSESIGSQPMERTQVVALRDKILEKIKSSEEEGGIEMDKLIIELRDSSPEMINQEVKRLIEDGIVFEPRPGKVRYLG
jgi:RPA family protein